MPGGRPRKPSSLRTLEGNPGRRDIPAEIPLEGTPNCPKYLTGEAAEHFKFLAAEFGGCGVLKRVDTLALAKLSDLWAKYRKLSKLVDDDPEDLKLLRACVQTGLAWDSAASKLGIQRIDRAKLVTGEKQESDPLESKYGVVG